MLMEINNEKWTSNGPPAIIRHRLISSLYLYIWALEKNGTQFFDD
jgi:hypothetical protein